VDKQGWKKGREIEKREGDRNRNLSRLSWPRKKKKGKDYDDVGKKGGRVRKQKREEKGESNSCSTLRKRAILN